MPNDSDKCADEQQSFCFYFDCCPSCQFEWTAAYHCDIDLESTSSTINSTCPLNCNGDNIITASGGISNGNGTSGGITNGGTSSGNTTSGNGTNSGSQIKNGATKYVTFYLFLLSILSLKVCWHLFTLCKESGAANRTHLVQQWRKSENQLNLMRITGSCLILVDIQAQNVVFLCKSKQGCTPCQTL